MNRHRSAVAVLIRHRFNPETMESRLVSGLYFAGELVDVDAICGGYNLTWAWASGYDCRNAPPHLHN